MNDAARLHPVQVYSAGLVLPISAPPAPGGAVAVRDGRILHVGARAWVRAALAERGLAHDEHHWPGVIMPGLVNAHTHLQYTHMADVGQRSYSGFDDWAASFNESYERPDHDWRAAAAEGAAQSISFGTTSAADVVTDSAARSALNDAGLHGIAFWEVMGWSNERWAEEGRGRVLDELDAVPTTPGVGICPHAPYSLDTEPLLDIPDLVRQRGLRLHIHLGESQFEQEFAEHGQGPLADTWREEGIASFRALRERGYGVGATEFIDQLGVLGPDCHIAHGVYMGARDRALLRARGAAVALCPRSNAVIGLDEPPVAAYLVEGNLVAVGTDSLSSSPSLDVLADVAVLYRIAREQGYRERDLASRLLSAATLGGAMSLGLGTGPHRVGQLQVGARADLAFVDVPATSVANALEELATDGAGKIAATAIMGELRWAGPRWDDAAALVRRAATMGPDVDG